MRKALATPARIDSARWASLRKAIVGALGSFQHKPCFMAAFRAVLEKGYGKVALAYRNGRPVAVLWTVSSSKEITPDRGRRRLRCDDADLRGVDDLLFDGVREGPLEIPADASVRREGSELATATTVAEMKDAFEKRGRQAVEWSVKPGAGSALVVHVQDGRLIWVGIHVTRGPKVPF